MMLQKLFKAFDIAKDPWWRMPYLDAEEVDFLLKDITSLRNIVKKEVSAEDPAYWKGYTEVHHEKYLMECINGECNTSNKLTSEHVKEMVNADALKKFESDEKKLPLVKKLQNLHQASKIMFPNIFLFEPPKMEKFDIGFVRYIHCLVGEGVIWNAGEFRTKPAKPAQELFFYLEPNLIEASLETLCKECRQVFADPNLQLIDAIKYGACFLETFLFIHPFSNGNGRVGRLLLSYLLTKYTIVPLSLYSTGDTRDVYLQCLREARKHRAEFRKPASLARFILENIQREFQEMCGTMDINKNSKINTNS